MADSEIFARDDEGLVINCRDVSLSDMKRIFVNATSLYGQKIDAPKQPPHAPLPPREWGWVVVFMSSRLSLYISVSGLTR